MTNRAWDLRDVGLIVQYTKLLTFWWRQSEKVLQAILYALEITNQEITCYTTFHKFINHIYFNDVIKYQIS